MGGATTKETTASTYTAPQDSEQLSLEPTMEFDVVRAQVMEVTKQIIGSGEIIQDDSPLLNVGLTSMSSAMLRDALARDFPAVNLPFTLAFDYPSVNSVAEFLIEGARAA